VKNLVTTTELANNRVIGGKRGTRRIGKVNSFVFHPTERRVIGFIVKRPDFLWMFRRKNLFVSIEGYELLDGRVCINGTRDAAGDAAYRALDVDPDECVLWVGLPIMTNGGQSFGFVGNVTFNRITGTVHSIESDAGMTSNVLLGKRDIPANLIKGFRKGMGTALAFTGNGASEQRGETEAVLGALLVSDKVSELEAEGGLAEKAGRGAAVVADKAGKSAAVVADKAGKVTTQVSKAASVGAKTAGKAVNVGAYATGKQIGKTKGMFSAFKDEYQKARHDD